MVNQTVMEKVRRGLWEELLYVMTREWLKAFSGRFSAPRPVA